MAVNAAGVGIDQQEFLRLMAGAKMWSDCCVEQFHELGRAMERFAEVVRDLGPLFRELQKQDQRQKQLRRLAKEQIHGRHGRH